jgi:eukaryotic-like serine/threonine-protein kinase
MQNSSAEILFEKFEITGCLKKDSCSSVYIANHIYLGKRIILKTLNTLELQDKVILERFKREAKILALLEHPNLIKVLDFGTYGNHFYLSFEYFESNNLRELISRQQLSYDQKHHLLVQLLKALNVAHQNNIIHRDIKPENILVNTNYDLKIADFGLAIILNENALTNKASIVGTPGYMSPEQIRGDNLSIQSDIFSAGLVALEVFTGSNPFIGKNINETINNILSIKEEKIDELISGLSPAIQQSIRMMLKKNPSDRGKSINEILNVLGVAGEFFTPVEVKIKKRSRNKAILVSSSMLSLFFTLLLVYFFSAEEKQGSPGLKTDSLNIFESQFLIEDSPAVQDSNLKLIAENNVNEENGSITVDALPWADVYVNNKKIKKTPVKDFNLSPGKYNIRLVHPDFPAFTRRIEVHPQQTEKIVIDFKELIGSLNCEIYPWGQIFINGEYKSETPLREPILLMPGNYKLTIKNPRYGSITETIRIKAKEVLDFKFNFESNQKL